MSDSSDAYTVSSKAEVAWPDELDALIAAPDNHTLLFENDRVRVLDTWVSPGGETPMHTHRWPATLYFLSWSHFVRRDNQGAVVLDSRTVPALRTPPPALWSAPLPPHSLQNVGDTELRVISVEIKD